MACYESIFILRSSLGDEEAEAVIEKMKSVLTKHGATIVKAENWGKKKLAYEIKHDRRGTYILLQFESAQENVVSELERLYRLEDSVIKFLTVRVEEEALQAVVAEEQGESESGGIQ
ncbi:MAG: 30S ribosomal protein S6 [Nitrospira sp.]|nr:30S ribosomal protein S6 [Nitrospira sp.]MXX11808.1 30S ribosomal protein S6 [Nitrospira sp. SB0667_bin_9]MYD31210.1 30S ribosomal protein S6 [Nitrospira sp. SB0661_bin_20]MYG40828.1 30S ribosomal protein S6 [Nitrospira sp. SB0677_bin_15]MYH02435.1 30S ribosomal protein S6 [Nitrospira sp. SB0675_bin_23]MYJ23666.1 30S ribosomal protein S6 [Nitrospira sp. SB0673_bin_12]